MANHSQIVLIDDLCNWEFVDLDKASIFDVQSFDSLSFSDESLTDQEPEQEQEQEHGVESEVENEDNKQLGPIINDENTHYDVDVDDDEYDDGDDDDEMDDELVPWGVKDRFERQRMRKLGKRAFAKMAKSKRSLLLINKPGCVRGKHGFGLKAY